VGGAKFYSGIFYLQQATGQFIRKPLEGVIESKTKLGEDLGSLLIDMDRDGDLDLYIARGGTEDKANAASFQDVIYANDGKGNFTLVIGALPSFFESNSSVRSVDFDRDGDLDIFVSGRNVPFAYPQGTVSRLFRNDSKSGAIKYTDVTAKVAPALLNKSLTCEGIWSDMNNDGWVDLILAGEFSPIQIYENQKGKLTPLKDTGLDAATGIWGSIVSADMDQDGDMDLVVGNMGKNTILRASKSQPVEVLHGDLDGNGVYDLVPFVYFQNESGMAMSYPLFGKDDTHKQLNSTRARYVYYKDFGLASQENLLSEAEKSKAQKLAFTENASVYVENLGKGRFKIHELPALAQVSAINGMQVVDINQDGYLDILYIGNNYANEVSSGRYDASNGGVLIGNGKGQFTYYQNSGLLVTGDAKSFLGIQLGKDQLAYIAFQNRGPMRVFKPLKPFEKIANQGKDYDYLFAGKKQHVSWTNGSSYLSQSQNAQLFAPKGAKLTN
jgi:hypothetical protein